MASTSSLASAPTGRPPSQAIGITESLKTCALYLVIAQLDLKPDPEAEATILRGPFNDSAGVRGQRAGRGQDRKPLPNLGAVIHRLKREV